MTKDVKWLSRKKHKTKPSLLQNTPVPVVKMTKQLGDSDNALLFYKTDAQMDYTTSDMKQYMNRKTEYLREYVFRLNQIPAFKLDGNFTKESLHHFITKRTASDDNKRLVEAFKHIEPLIKNAMYLKTSENRYKNIEKSNKDPHFIKMHYAITIAQDTEGYFPVLFHIKERDNGKNSLYCVTVGGYFDLEKIFNTTKEATLSVDHSQSHNLSADSTNSVDTDRNSLKEVTSLSLSITDWLNGVNKENNSLIRKVSDDLLSPEALSQKKLMEARSKAHFLNIRLRENNLIYPFNQGKTSIPYLTRVFLLNYEQIDTVEDNLYKGIEADVRKHLYKERAQKDNHKKKTNKSGKTSKNNYKPYKKGVLEHE